MASDQTIGIIWDLDGVLVDTGRYHFLSWQDTLGKRGIDFGEDKFRQIFGRTNAESLQTILGRKPSSEEEEAIPREKEETFRKLIRGKADLLPGVAHFLEAFHQHGCRQAIGSSAPQENIDQLVDELKIRDCFQSILATKGIPGKPDPEIFLRSARAINIPPANCLVIEDAIPGIEAAHRGGMACLAVATTHPVGDLATADRAVYRLDEISPDEALTLVNSHGGRHDR